LVVHFSFPIHFQRATGVLLVELGLKPVCGLLVTRLFLFYYCPHEQFCPKVPSLKYHKAQSDFDDYQSPGRATVPENYTFTQADTDYFLWFVQSLVIWFSPGFMNQSFIKYDEHSISVRSVDLLCAVNTHLSSEAIYVVLSKLPNCLPF
jgi:hypothetical protein